jgi:hypothetical protein
MLPETDWENAEVPILAPRTVPNPASELFVRNSRLVETIFFFFHN